MNVTFGHFQLAMNNLDTASGHPSFASKTTYEALAVDSGEESEEEQIPEPASQLTPPERYLCDHRLPHFLFIYSLVTVLRSLK